MGKFVCITQTLQTNQYIGPSGTKYMSIRGKPFEVTNKIDLKWITTKTRVNRFKKWNIFMKEKQESDVDVVLYDKMKKIGLDDKDAEIVRDIYMQEKNVIDAVEHNYKLDISISEPGRLKIKAWVSEETDPPKQPDKPEPETDEEKNKRLLEENKVLKEEGMLSDEPFEETLPGHQENNKEISNQEVKVVGNQTIHNTDLTGDKYVPTEPDKDFIDSKK